MDPTTQALIETIGAAGYVVNIEAAGGLPVVTAISGDGRTKAIHQSNGSGL